MDIDEEIAYASQRESEERRAAAATPSRAAAEAHRDMAERYADRIWSLEEGHAEPRRERRV